MNNLQSGALLALTVLFLSTGASIIAPIAVDAATKTVTKSYRHDKNKFTGARSNFHAYKYRQVPTNYYESWSTAYQVGSGWNYTRYENIVHCVKR